MSADWVEKGGVPSDARLEKDWTADDAPAAHKAAWEIYNETPEEKAARESREIEASNARSDWYFQNNERIEADS